MQTPTISLLIPTCNAGKRWAEVIDAINKQSVQQIRKIIIDSASTDDTPALAAENGFEVINISRKEFNHGATRQLLADLAKTDIIIFLTQDAIPADELAFKNIIEVFNDANTGMAYGRQLPHQNAGHLETHARLFNYPAAPAVRSLSEREELGFKACFCSNSFAAYRYNALQHVGGFPSASIMGEDTLVAAKMLLAGYKVAYAANACVHHSHSYTFAEEYRRYFDTRVFHEQNKWLIENFGKPTGEGLRFVKSEIKYVLNNAPLTLFRSIGSLFAKWVGYKVGKYYTILPKKVLKYMSMHVGYWK
ncbi:glycosyltransferase family 2 protein [Mucilaginibacter limnophilus]|uniref:Glycosyltransferase family 2 protein n=1 Tax=Mucilaginibacter limnophilus TaxID=1932778 RepID=A0A437MTE5_9SPHI|nr:glycosyltransferase [Mucilaginibacter limnophilus]RVU00926.1 glycosyltransferase family 2 protein [Mucilaginibacter limnophilus]